MDKLTMAHECAMKLVGNPTTPLKTMEVIVDVSWKYADAMQAEADKRIKSEVEEKRKNVREMLKADSTFLEKEGGHFDDVEWQPDWSQVPIDANYWAKDSSEKAAWFTDKPFIAEFVSNEWVCKKEYWDAPLFDYQGDWKDSLRKRP